MQTIICGDGQIGNSLGAVFGIMAFGKHEVAMIEMPPEVLHIAFPYSEEFISEVKRYQESYKPRFTVIHSTVPPGTSRMLNAIHSPVIGLHPRLEESLTTFTKFLSGEHASEVADYFRRAGMKVYLFDKQETTEWMKLLDTTFYKKCIEYTQEVKRVCVERDIPFEAWTIWTENYNRGYQKLGYPEFTRPNLVPIMTEIGGHCLIPNEKILFDALDEKDNNPIHPSPETAA